MKISIYSELANKERGIKWFRGGDFIEYKKYSDDPLKYALSFYYCFEYDNDTVSFAFAEPYTYTDLINYIEEISSNTKYKKIFKCESLCNTISGLRCNLITITSPEVNPMKKGIVLTARVHPGETVGSWVIKGAIEFLLSQEHDAEFLRENCVFKIVPMLNSDGVVQGNYRCSLSGCDLNRRYIIPSKILHPEIYYLKEMTKKLSKENPLLFYCDFHGHSKK